MNASGRIRIRPLVAGNWKMNGLRRDAAEVRRIVRELKKNPASCDVLICPPATLMAGFSALSRHSALRIGGQDCHPAVSGAHTGDIAAPMLKEAGAWAVILGHSERRTAYGDSDKLVWAKAEAAHAAGLIPIVCIGESAAQRRSKQTLSVISRQLRGLAGLPDACLARIVIAYEPLWAIGTGKIPKTDDIARVHGHIRSRLVRRMKENGNKRRILYGGSVSAANAAELMAVPDVNGLLVGGASLKARDFLPVIRACG